MCGRQPIEHHYTLDHVGHHGGKGAILNVYRDDSGNFITHKTTHGAIHPDDAGWTPETRRSQPQVTRRRRNGASQRRKFHGGEC